MLYYISQHSLDIFSLQVCLVLECTWMPVIWVRVVRWRGHQIQWVPFPNHGTLALVIMQLIILKPSVLWSLLSAVVALHKQNSIVVSVTALSFPFYIEQSKAEDDMRTFHLYAHSQLAQARARTEDTRTPPPSSTYERAATSAFILSSSGKKSLLCRLHLDLQVLYVF